MLCLKCGLLKQNCTCFVVKSTRKNFDLIDQTKKMKPSLVRNEIDHPLEGPHPTD